MILTISGHVALSQKFSCGGSLSQLRLFEGPEVNLVCLCPTESSLSS